MDPREKTGLKEHKRLLLEEIRGHRYAIRNHVLVANGNIKELQHKTVSVVHTMRFAPAAASFVAGLLRGRKSGHKGTGKSAGGIRGVATALLSGYALWNVLK